MLYFDHNSTTALAPEAAATLAAASREIFGNPSSTHAAGQLARRHLEDARRTIAAALHASPAEIVFTSGGTESNNLAILGLVRNLPHPRHIVTTAIEHPSVLECFHQLAREGVAVTFLPVPATGILDPAELRRHLRPDTALVSVMHANNEVGTIQPLAEIAALLREANIFFHSDGVQSFGKLANPLPNPGPDLYSISAHKIFGPKGVGALYVRKGVPLRGIQYGGRHERERRAGTENVPAILAFARAVELCSPDSLAPLAALRDRFETQVLAALPDVEINGAAHCNGARLPNTSSLLFPDVSAEALVIALDLKGIAVSTGSACTSGSLEPSHVLLAIGRTRAQAKSSVRFSFGRCNSADEVDTLAAAVTESARRLRASANRPASKPEAQLAAH